MSYVNSGLATFFFGIADEGASVLSMQLDLLVVVNFELDYILIVQLVHEESAQKAQATVPQIRKLSPRSEGTIVPRRNSFDNPSFAASSGLLLVDRAALRLPRPILGDQVVGNLFLEMLRLPNDIHGLDCTGIALTDKTSQN